jgi:hypothetical protein
MMENKLAIERAFEMARSGAFETVTRIRAGLRQEGYYDHEIIGPFLLKQLRDLIDAARSALPIRADTERAHRKSN